MTFPHCSKNSTWNVRLPTSPPSSSGLSFHLCARMCASVPSCMLAPTARVQSQVLHPNSMLSVVCSLCCLFRIRVTACQSPRLICLFNTVGISLCHVDTHQPSFDKEKHSIRFVLCRLMKWKWFKWFKPVTNTNRVKTMVSTEHSIWQTYARF